jgi:hypothetical protein
MAEDPTSSGVALGSASVAAQPSCGGAALTFHSARDEAARRPWRSELPSEHGREGRVGPTTRAMSVIKEVLDVRRIERKREASLVFPGASSSVRIIACGSN